MKTTEKKQSATSEKKPKESTAKTEAKKGISIDSSKKETTADNSNGREKINDKKQRGETGWYKGTNDKEANRVMPYDEATTSGERDGKGLEYNSNEDPSNNSKTKTDKIIGGKADATKKENNQSENL